MLQSKRSRLVPVPTGKCRLGRPRKWNFNIKMDVGEICSRTGGGWKLNVLRIGGVWKLVRIVPTSGLCWL